MKFQTLVPRNGTKGKSLIVIHIKAKLFSLHCFRCLEQLQYWLSGNPVDHLSTPLFIPSSTLLTTPTAVQHAPTAKTQDTAFTQV